MRAKVCCVRVEPVEYSGIKYSEEIGFRAVYSGENNAEDNTFSEATPNALFTLTVTNKSLWETIKVGDYYYVDFIPVSK